MDTDRNLLFGVISMQSGLIDSHQFVEACSHWAAHKHLTLAELLIKRELISETDRSHIEYLLERRLEKHSGDVTASIASIPGAIRRSLSNIEDPDIQQSLAQPTSDDPRLAKTGVFTLESPVWADPSERYELTEMHATGGMGQVWRAWDRSLNRSVALKELKPELSDDNVLRARFRREATITGQLEHPGIVPVYDFVIRPELEDSFYTMRMVNGRTLAEAAREFHDSRESGSEADMMAFVQLLNAFVTVCNTVAYAHSKGIVHRDLKGQNVVLGDFGETVVLDWGFAKRPIDSETEESARGGSLSGADDSELTVHGEALGTPAYMAPEQAAGQSIDHRTDVYGLGAILYFVLTGKPPFNAPKIEQVLHKVRSEQPRSPREFWPEVPPTLEAACLRALAKDPTERFESAVELGHEVEQWQEVQRMKAEWALRDSEALYRSLVDVLPLILVRKDLDCRFTFANNRACESFGTSLEEIVGKTDFDFFPNELAELSQRSDREVFQTGDTIKYEPFLYVDRGEERYFRSIKTPVRDASGQIIGVQIVTWDVTEQKRLEEALRNSETLYRSLVDILPLILVRKDLKSRFTFANKRYCEAMGKSHEELIGKTDFDFFPRDIADEYQRHDRHVFATEESLEAEEKFLEHGELRDIRVIKSPTYDPHGELDGLQIIVWDVTEQKRLDRALRESEAFYQALIESLPQGILRKDGDGVFTYVNQGACDLLGLGRDDILGKTDFDICPPEIAEQYRRDDHQVMASGKRYDVVETNETTGVSRHYVQTVKTPVYDTEGSPIGIQAIFWDVSERRQLKESLQRKTDELDRLREELRVLKSNRGSEPA